MCELWLLRFESVEASEALVTGWWKVESVRVLGRDLSTDWRRICRIIMAGGLYLWWKARVAEACCLLTLDIGSHPMRDGISTYFRMTSDTGIWRTLNILALYHSSDPPRYL